MNKIKHTKWGLAKMTLKIESGIPVPESRRPLIGNFPFADMKVGDSFSLNGMRPSTIGYVAAVFARRQEPKWKLTVRKTVNGHRCWRIE